MVKVGQRFKLGIDSSFERYWMRVCWDSVVRLGKLPVLSRSRAWSPNTATKSFFVTKIEGTNKDVSVLGSWRIWSVFIAECCIRSRRVRFSGKRGKKSNLLKGKFLGVPKAKVLSVLGNCLKCGRWNSLKSTSKQVSDLGSWRRLSSPESMTPRTRAERSEESGASVAALMRTEGRVREVKVLGSPSRSGRKMKPWIQTESKGRRLKVGQPPKRANVGSLSMRRCFKLVAASVTLGPDAPHRQSTCRFVTEGGMGKTLTSTCVDCTSNLNVLLQ